MPERRHLRRFLQFRLRGLLLLMLLVAALSAAWAVFIEPYRGQRLAMEAIRAAGGGYKTRPGGAAWMRRMFGPEHFHDVVDARVSADSLLEQPGKLTHLARLTRVESLEISGQKFRDADLQRLARLPALARLTLVQTSVSRRGIDALQRARPRLAIIQAMRLSDLARLPALGSTEPVVATRLARQMVGLRVRVQGYALRHVIPATTADPSLQVAFTAARNSRPPAQPRQFWLSNQQAFT